jgi:hypothetical protein
MINENKSFYYRAIFNQLGAIKSNYSIMNINNMFRIFFIGIFLSISQTLVGQEKKQIQKKTIIDTIPFILTSHNNISIKAILGSVDTLNLMFHTAASTVSLTTKATGKIKSIHWNSQVDLGSWGGRANSRYSKNNSIEIGNLNWDNVEIWEVENSGPATDGKFGLNLFDGYYVEIDYDKNLLLLHETLPIKAEIYLKMELFTKKSGFFIQGTSTINGLDYKNQFLIHSGYGGVILFDNKFAAESKIGERIEIIEEKELKDSFGNVLKIKKGSLPKFTIGNIDLLDIPIGFFEGKIAQQDQSVIGGDLLKRFNIIIDANREFIYLKTNQLKNIAYTQFEN